jgi:hypothetical protein
MRRQERYASALEMACTLRNAAEELARRRREWLLWFAGG